MGSQRRVRTVVCPHRCGIAFFATASLCTSAFLLVLMRWAVCVIAPHFFYEGIPIWYMLGHFQAKTGHSIDSCFDVQQNQVWMGAGLFFNAIAVLLLLVVASYLVLDKRRCAFAPAAGHKADISTPAVNTTSSA